MDHVRDISEKFIQLADTLLDVPDLGLAFDDQRFLEVDFALIGKDGLLLLKLLLRLTSFLRWRCDALLLQCRSLCRGRCSLLLQCLPL